MVKRDIVVLKGGDPDHTAAAIKGQFSFFKSTSGPSVILSVLKSAVRLLCTAIESFESLTSVHRPGSVTSDPALFFSGFQATKKGFFLKFFVIYLPYILHYYIYISLKDNRK
jgi:hypothetical protein